MKKYIILGIIIFSSHPRRRRFRPFFRAQRRSVGRCMVGRAGSRYELVRRQHPQPGNDYIHANDDKTITVDHRVQQGSKKWKAAFRARGPLTAAGLIVTTKTGREGHFLLQPYQQTD